MGNSIFQRSKLNSSLSLVVCVALFSCDSNSSNDTLVYEEINPNLPEARNDFNLSQNALDFGMNPSNQSGSSPSPVNRDMPLPSPPQVPPCRASVAGPSLPPNRTEADPEYISRLNTLDVQSLPEVYDLTDITGLRRSVIGYMLDLADFTLLSTSDLINRGAMGRAILLALGTDPQPSAVDLKELRRGLYHFYNCDRQFPETLEGFKAQFGDFDSWPSTLYENSFPKIDPRRLRQDPARGIYIAETMKDGLVHETEILLEGYRNDGALEFLAYAPNGYIASTGEFQTGSSFTAAPSPYTCMACHLNTDRFTYDVVFPDMTRDTSPPPNDQMNTPDMSPPDNPPNPMEEECGLEIWVEARDEIGPCSTCRAGDYITVAAVLYNHCTQSQLSYDFPLDCLVSEFTVLNLDSMASSIYSSTCQSNPLTIELNPQESFAQTRPVGRLSPANYTVTAQFEDQDQMLISFPFSVE